MRYHRDRALFALADTIRARRATLGQSQAQVAASAGIDAGIVSRIENGYNCRLSTVSRVLEVLGLELVLVLKEMTT